MRERTTVERPAVICQECGHRGPNAAEFHPYLFCELVKLGHHDPGAYLKSYGFVYNAAAIPVVGRSS